MEKESNKLEEWQIEDAARLEALFKSPDRKTPLSQAEFGDRFGLGSQGMVSQYLKAHRPLNILAAARFAQGLRECGLDITVEDFSPTLAIAIKEAYAQTRLTDFESRLLAMCAYTTDQEKEGLLELVDNYLRARPGAREVVIGSAKAAANAKYDGSET